MKVIDGAFGQEKETITLGESVNEVLELTELATAKEAKYVIVVEDSDRLYFASNHKCSPNIIAALEQAKLHVILGGMSDE